MIDPPIHVYDNTIFSDNYYETAQAYPHGESVTGAHNVFLSGSGINHSAIHTYYYGTVDRAADQADRGVLEPEVAPELVRPLGVAEAKARLRRLGPRLRRIGRRR